MELKLTAYRLGSGIWAFDHPHNDTIGEPLVNGTELAIDEYYERVNGRKPQEGDQIGIHLSTSEIEGADSVLEFLSTDSAGTLYMDHGTGKIVWLCPWLQGYFGLKPKKMYAKVLPAESKEVSEIAKGYAVRIAEMFGVKV